MEVVDVVDSLDVALVRDDKVGRKPLVVLRYGIAIVVLFEVRAIEITSDVYNFQLVAIADKRLLDTQTVERRVDEIENLLVGAWVPVFLVLWDVLEDGNSTLQLLCEFRGDERARLIHSVNGGFLEC